MANNTTKLPKRPTCDLCKQKPAIADARIPGRGAWAYLCSDHFKSVNATLGLGRGQLLLCGDEIDSTLVSD